MSEGNVAFKIKTTAPKHYIVSPNQGILDRGQKIMIKIIWKSNKPGPLTQQFLIENKIGENKFKILAA
jgi:hypothetical protein